MGGFESERRIDTTRLWSGGLATAVVAGLIALVGMLLIRGVLGVAVLAPHDAGVLGGVVVGGYALMAAVAALAATGLLHALLLTAPRPATFFGWIVGLATLVAAVGPVTQDAPAGGQIATGIVNAVTGLVITSLLGGVGAGAMRRAHGGRPLLHAEGALPDVGYAPGWDGVPSESAPVDGRPGGSGAGEVRPGEGGAVYDAGRRDALDHGGAAAPEVTGGPEPRRHYPDPMAPGGQN
ncbi:DUF6069 family protein [Nocardiopsis sediminis]|uniref:DUF6069 family protein n=1 Tax=Nocardiopsis sediminis TaxID=1778267 RepID=A0ABV8FF81_9ACTN